MKRTGIQGNVLPVMFGFMMMALVDVVGLTSNYVRAEFGMSDTIANLLSSACYIWFLAFSIPTGLAMNRYGRKKLVITSLLVSVAALALPVAFRGSLFPVLVAFCLMGIANTIMMTSLNPLVRDIVPADKLAGTLTLGQFFKSIASMGAPLLMPLVAARRRNCSRFPVRGFIKSWANDRHCSVRGHCSGRRCLAVAFACAECNTVPQEGVRRGRRWRGGKRLRKKYRSGVSEYI